MQRSSLLLLGGKIYSIPCRGSSFAYRTILNNRKNCARMIWKKRTNSSLFFKIVLGKTASVARNWINSSPKTEGTTFAFPSVFILLLCYIVLIPIGAGCGGGDSCPGGATGTGASPGGPARTPGPRPGPTRCRWGAGQPPKRARLWLSIIW